MMDTEAKRKKYLFEAHPGRMLLLWLAIGVAFWAVVGWMVAR